MFCSSFPVPWHDCAIQGETIDSTSDVADASKVNYDSPNKETCSDDCHKDASCAFWTYHEQAKLCTWKTAEDNKVPNDNVWHGSENCSGIGRTNKSQKMYPVIMVLSFQLTRPSPPAPIPSTATGPPGPHSSRHASRRRPAARFFKNDHFLITSISLHFILQIKIFEFEFPSPVRCPAAAA